MKDVKNSDKKFRVSSNKRNSSVLALFTGFIVTMIIINALVDVNDNILFYVLICAAVGVALAVLCLVFVREYYMHILPDGFVDACRA